MVIFSYFGDLLDTFMFITTHSSLPSSRRGIRGYRLHLLLGHRCSDI